MVGMKWKDVSLTVRSYYLNTMTPYDVITGAHIYNGKGTVQLCENLCIDASFRKGIMLIDDHAIIQDIQEVKER